MIGKLIKTICKGITIVSYVSCFVSLVAIPSNVIEKVFLVAILIWAVVRYVSIMSGDGCKAKNQIHIVDIVSVGMFIYDINRDLKIKLIIDPQSSGQTITKSIELDYVVPFLSMILLVILINMYLETKGCNTRMQIKRALTYAKYKAIYSFLYLIGFFHRDTQERFASAILGIESNELTIMSAAARYKRAHKRELEEKFPVVLRKDASQAQMWRHWDFNISLVSADRIHIEKDNITNSILVNIAYSNLSLINNAGKKFLREYYNNQSAIEKVKESLSLIEASVSKETQQVNGNNNFFFRWGSAGVLPVVKYKNELWIMLVFREITPIGWNLPLGGSKNEEEKKRPAITSIREMLEEVIVVKYNGKKGGELTSPKEGVETHHRMAIFHPFIERIKANTSFCKGSEAFYRRQHDIMRDTYQIQLVDDSAGSHVKCDDITTNMRVCVIDSIDGYPNNAVFTNDVFYIVNPEEQGIECIKPIVMKIEGDCTLRMGEIDFSNDTWINNPMILIKYSVVEKYMKANPNIQGLRDSACAGGAVIPELFSDSTNYELFNVNIDEREQRINDLLDALKYSGLSEQEIEKKANKRPLRIWRNKWKHYRMVNELRYQMNISKTIKECFCKDPNGHAKVEQRNPNVAYQFCPTTWKAIRELVKVFDPSKIDEYCNYKIGD